MGSRVTNCPEFACSAPPLSSNNLPPPGITALEDETASLCQTRARGTNSSSRARPDCPPHLRGGGNRDALLSGVRQEVSAALKRRVWRYARRINTRRTGERALARRSRACTSTFLEVHTTRQTVDAHNRRRGNSPERCNELLEAPLYAHPDVVTMRHARRERVS